MPSKITAITTTPSVAAGAIGGSESHRSCDVAEEGPLFAQDETLALRECEILHALGVGAQPGAIALVVGETGEGNQSPADIVRALVRQEIADEMAAGAGDELAPALRVLAKSIQLRRVDFVADETGDRHGLLLQSPRVNNSG